MKSLRIGGFDYSVEYVPLVNNAVARYGEIDSNHHTIKISSEFSSQQQECTLLHEMIHGLDHWLGIGLEEEQVEKLGKGLYEFLKDNPSIMNRL